jgi:hypothetical protein
MRESLVIEIGWPAKELSPNSRCHHMVKHRYAKAAKTEAGWATKIAKPINFGGDRFDVHIRAYPPKNWSTADKDGFVSRLKWHLDAIAEAIGVNDRQFEAPSVEWCDKTEHGHVVIILRPREAEAA